MKRLVCLLFFGACTTILFAQHQHEQSQATSTAAKVLMTQALAGVDLTNQEVTMMIVEFPPNNVGGAHRHPGQTFGYLLEGELESVFEGKTYSYKPGDTFYEFPNGLHSSTHNPSATVTAKLLVFFINEKGKPNTIPEK
jgi:quercetin dioxygenase-like cupin family protein